MPDFSAIKVTHWMEAKTLAGHLAPLLEKYEMKWRGHGFIYVDHEFYNIDTANRLLADLSADFGVPTQLIRSRLIELGWLKDVRSVLPVRHDVARIIEKRVFSEANELYENEPEMNDEYDQN